jgi:hypothetical protein
MGIMTKFLTKSPRPNYKQPNTEMVWTEPRVYSVSGASSGSGAGSGTIIFLKDFLRICVLPEQIRIQSPFTDPELFPDPEPVPDME